MNRFVSCLLCCVLILCAVPAALSQSLSFGKAAPPIPGSIIGKIHGLGHPFLLASRDHFRETRQLMHQEVNLPRNKRFLHRVNQYNKKDSPWYVGEGPLSTNENFHPAFLPEADFLFYTKVIIETLIFYGIEHDRWVETACTAEFLRLLDEMEFGLVVNPDSLEDAFITPRQASLLAITTLIKDMYFRRFETLERHDYTARYKAQRDQLALACASADLNGFPAYQRAMLGTALGLSSLLCIAIHPVEWRRDGAVAVESFLPDLYRAVNLTRDGYHDLLSDDGRITCTFEELELLVMLSSPWIECMKALGYPYCLEADEYSRLVTGLEMHRIKGTHNILEPMDLGRVTTPWIPKTAPLYIADNMALYPKTTLPTMNPMLATAREPQMAPEDEKIDEILQGDLSSLPSPQQPAPLDSGANLRPTRMTLREQLEKFGLPRAPAPAQTKDSTDMVVTVEPGWFAPPTVILPRALNFLYQQAAKENPASKAATIWRDEFWPDNTHPYVFLYYKRLNITTPRESVQRVSVSYPNANFTMHSVDSHRVSYVLASQSATDTLVSPTFELTHDSFILSEEQTGWRWFHDIVEVTPVAVLEGVPLATNETEEATGVTAVTDSVSIPVGEDSWDVEANSPYAPLRTSLYSLWTTASPVGKTLVVRRGEGGVGSSYTIFAHIPDPTIKNQRVGNVVFSLAGNATGKMNEEISDFLSIVPENAEKLNEPVSIDAWRRRRQAERLGKIKPVHAGILQVLFSPDALKNAVAYDGVIGSIYQAELADPHQPFFYLTILDQPGREMFEVKYGGIPIPGTRIIEWTQGIEMIVFNPGQKTTNPFVDTDADLVIASRDRAMKGLFFLMVNGSYLRAKFSATQENFLLLVNTKGEKLTCAWSDRKVSVSSPPKNGSVFYAPGIVGFECPGNTIQYGIKSKQVSVWGHTPSEK